MKIVSLSLQNFRNYESLEVDFHDGINMIYGNNAQGKTNILESIFTSATTKSHKNVNSRELIRIGFDEAHIRLILNKNGIDQKIDMHLRKNKSKGIAINGVPIRKSGELMGLLNVVFFAPEDLNIIKNGPDERRRFMDMELCQLDNIYFHNLSEYKKALNQRNKLLKQIYYNPSLKDTLYIWDEMLVEYGKIIISTRESFNRHISELLEKVSKKLTGNLEQISAEYIPNVIVDEYENEMKKSLEKDLRTMTTNIGPHRDDIMFMNDGVNLKKYGSQGQQRTCALALKLAEIELVKKITNDTPILLLDDVLSELDRNRQNYLLENIKDIQTMITCTGLEEFVNSNLEIDRILKVVSGTVTVEK
ncbi:MAG: DNA replication/repair protein RecF [Lachnospiraceae bacterium]|nr:DNA replication/repair protein RecF [Lachnospiraceae bacterium]